MSDTHASNARPGMGEAGTTRTSHEHHELGFIRKYIFSTDHKVIGIQFMLLGLVFFVLGGLFAMAIRYQLAWPWESMPVIGDLLFPNTGQAITPEFYTMLFTMHGTIMIFFVIIPLLTGAFGNFLIPLMIGAPDMAFPKLNMFGFWAMIPAIFCVLMSFHQPGGGPAAGWTAYPTLSTIESAAPGSVSAQTWWLLALTWVGVSSMMGAVNYVTTIVKMRAPGMTMFRMPLTVWALWIAALLQLFALPVLTAASLMQVSDRVLHSGFFTPTNLVINQLNPEGAGAAAGGQPLLWQHLFWFYSHPAVYIMVVPAMGLASDILSVHARKPIFGYKPMVYSMSSIAGLGFIVWGHHMFASGMNPALGMTFMVATMMIALPSAIKVFNWLGTLWGARIQLTTPMLFILGFIAMFIIGGLSGIWMAATPVDIYIHDTYIIVAHFHYVVFAGSVFAIFAAIYHWFPKMFGRVMNETLGKIHFVGSFIFTNGVFYMMHQLGMAGLMRRTADPYDYETYAHLQPLNVFITISAFCLFVWQIFFVWNFFHSMFWGKRVGRNPWNACSLEWEAPSPPGHGNFDHALRVHRGPYEYASPDVEEDFFAQTREVESK
ncbi:MAG TPA: cytochrome c oxidase subunit I [Planctomycetes bacterium]|nr:cytochrome c oxidase subunit I [Planctomycetota bacterium]HIL36834.1 cytochrome c oxidase subunit I [Planctomycetota bacterium]